MNFKENESTQKLNGRYYTPDDLATFITKWTCSGVRKEVLEPSCGDGVFFDALNKLSFSKTTNVTAFELDSHEAGKAQARANQIGISAQVHDRDFLKWALGQIHDGGQQFDAVIGNPPFIRYQYLPSNFQTHSEQIFDYLNCKFTKHTNAWVPFILASVALLRPGGRLGMVVPAEIIHVAHAQSLRSFLGEQCKRLVIIDPEKLWFEDTLQGAVIILAEKKQSLSEKSDGLGIVSVRNREFVCSDPEKFFYQPRVINGKTVSGKWTRALLGKEILSLLDNLEQNPCVHRFKDLANVDVGIVTGANKFFFVPSEIIEQYGLEVYSHPMFGRSEHCPGILYDERQHQRNVADGKPTNFIWFQKSNAIHDKRVWEYIKLGETQKLHTRFKCQARTPWYSVPSVYSTKIGMPKRAHNIPRLVLNKIGAFTTDTVYRVCTIKTPAEKFVSCFINPLTSLSAELEGRYYGGGVLELVPSEIEKLAIPLPEKSNVNIKALDKAIRSRPAIDILADNGRKILGEIGVSEVDQQRLMDSWLTLRNRRNRVSTEPERA